MAKAAKAKRRVPRRRHRFIFRALQILVGPLLRAIYRYSCTVETTLPSPAIIVANHTTDLDPAFLGISFNRQMYFVASEHVSRWGIWSKLLSWAFQPIWRVKGKTDARVGMEVLKRLRGGDVICLFAEGNRSFNGLTGPVVPSTGKLVKGSGAHLVTFRLEGGYFAAPRWGKKMRKGPIHGSITGIYPPEALAEMDADAINLLIQQNIDEDAYRRQERDPAAYTGKNLAEHIETALYLCPKCGGLGTITSAGGGFGCACGLRGAYDEYGMLSGEGFSFTTVRDWDLWQQQQTPGLAAGPGLLCSDGGQTLLELDAADPQTAPTQGALALYADRLEAAGHVFPLATVSDMAIVGRQTLLFSTAEGRHYEVKSAAPRSALKYLRLYEALRKARQTQT